MRKLTTNISLLSLFVFFVLSLTSCSKSGSSSTATPSIGDTLKLSVSTDTVENNGWDMVTISVKNKNGEDITSSCNILVNDTLTSSKNYYPKGYGNYIVKATLGNLTSNNGKFYSKPASNISFFTKKLLVEDYTGTWCGFCPREAYLLDSFTKMQSKCIWVTVHGYVGTSDPYIYQNEPSMESKFGITGFPTTITNRYTTWTDEKYSSLNTEFSKYTCLGLAIQSSVSGSTISGKAQVKFSVNTDKPLKIVVALIESGLLYNQANYYSPSGGHTPYLYGGKNPIPNFEEKNVLRKTFTNTFGDVIPSTSTNKETTYELPFTFSTTGVTASGSSFTVNPANCKIVAYVVDGSATNWNSSKGVINVQSAAVGQTQNFD